MERTSSELGRLILAILLKLGTILDTNVAVVTGGAPEICGAATIVWVIIGGAWIDPII